MATKKLEMGHDKCFQIHVGKNDSEICPQLSINKKVMKTSSSETYLGDLLTNDGKIDSNIQSRYDKGVGVNNTIFALLQEVSFGTFFFEMSILFRSSMLVNKILCSSEVLYGVKERHLEILEKCDKFFFTKLFGVPSSCSYESYFLETGALPLRFIFMGRRLMYLWSLLNKSDSELAKNVFMTQKLFPTTDDWVVDFVKLSLLRNKLKK